MGIDMTRLRMSSGHREKHLRLVLLLFCLPLIGIGSAVQAQSLPLFRIGNGNSGETPAVLWIGAEQGFYRKQGLNVEIIFIRNGPLSLAAMAAGDVQMIFGASNTVLNGAAAGMDVVAVANIVSRPEGDFIARPEIQKPDDLKGKQIAIQSIGGGGWANNMLALDYLGLDPDRDQIRFLVIGDQANRVQAMEAGRIQAAWMAYTFSGPLKKKGYNLLVDLGKAPIAYLGSSLLTRRQFIRQDPKPIEAAIKGTLDSIRFILKPENKAAVTRSLMRGLRLGKLEEAENGYQALQRVYSTDLRPKPEGVRTIYRILSKVNPKLQKLKPEDIIDDSLIQKIYASGY